MILHSIKQKLLNEGVNFNSDTDTEVACAIIIKLYLKIYQKDYFHIIIAERIKKIN